MSDFDAPVSTCPSCLCRRRGEGCDRCGWNTPIPQPKQGHEWWRDLARGGVTPVAHAGGVFRELGSEVMLEIEGIE